MHSGMLHVQFFCTTFFGGGGGADAATGSSTAATGVRWTAAAFGAALMRWAEASVTRPRRTMRDNAHKQ
jgi:hypothetical protein